LAADDRLAARPARRYLGDRLPGDDAAECVELFRRGARSLGMGDGFVIAHQATGELAARWSNSWSQTRASSW
jgi:hypothetical protein